MCGEDKLLPNIIIIYTTTFIHLCHFSEKGYRCQWTWETIKYYT